jgi:hypothetical protein
MPLVRFDPTLEQKIVRGATICGALELANWAMIALLLSSHAAEVDWKMYGGVALTAWLSLFVINSGVEVARGTGA